METTNDQNDGKNNEQRTEETEIPKLIEGVKEHKCIWDMQSEDYYNKKMYRAAWKTLVPLEDPIPEQPDKQNKAAQKKKIAALKEIWVDIRNSYFRNDKPGKNYKDSLRFLDCVYQSREIEDVLEFDAPSWDLMDLRTWSVKQSHIPKAKRRLRDPAPEYKKEVKRPRLVTKEENKTDKKDKDQEVAKSKIAKEENKEDSEKNKDNDKNKQKGDEKDNDENKDKDNENKTEDKKETTEKKLSILEKAMTLYEIENPGVWDSDEGEQSDKESKTYTEASTQTDEFNEEESNVLENMSIVLKLNN